jgi:DNA-binding CsgD family transcriptional regulator
MTDQDFRSWRWAPAWVCASWVAIVAAACGLWAGLLTSLWPNPASTTKLALDPSVVLNNFITVYVLFLTGFGVLAGLLTAKKDAREIWKPVAIVLLIGAAGVDLWRVLDATHDLFNAATSGLSRHNLNDTVHDFVIYFVINVFVVGFAVLAVCLSSGSPKTPSAFWKQMMQWLGGTFARPAKPAGQLSGREREVLALVAEGLSNRAIATRLFVTERTVEAHVNQIFQKLGLTADLGSHRRVLAVLAYLRQPA